MLSVFNHKIYTRPGFRKQDLLPPPSIRSFLCLLQEPHKCLIGEPVYQRTGKTKPNLVRTTTSDLSASEYPRGTLLLYKFNELFLFWFFYIYFFGQYRNLFFNLNHCSYMEHKTGFQSKRLEMFDI